jgi:hypothetical protein
MLVDVIDDWLGGEEAQQDTPWDQLWIVKVVCVGVLAERQTKGAPAILDSVPAPFCWG